MIHLEEIDYRNVWDIIGLEVTEPQEEFVASNRISLVQAYSVRIRKRKHFLSASMTMTRRSAF